MSSWRWITCEKTSAIEFFKVLSRCGFHIYHLAGVAFTSLSKSASVFLILTTCFFRGKLVTFDTNVYAIARKNLFHSCTVPGGASANVIIYRSRPAPVRYVTTQEIFLIVRCPGDNQICRWIANRWNRAASVLFVTIALNFNIWTGQRALNDHISRQI